MAASVLVDSNVYIGLLRRGVDPVVSLGDWIGNGDLVICGMIRMEVERGLRVEKIRHRMAGFFDVMINVPTTNNIWEASTETAWLLGRKGITVPAQDILIAESASAIGAAVLTDDRHFSRIPGVRLLQPEEELPDW